MFNIEMPDCDSSAEDWLHLSERALVKGNFLSNNMVAGLQTLVSLPKWIAEDQPLILECLSISWHTCSCA